MASNGTRLVCPPPMKATSNGAFQGDSPLHYALPLAILQICLVLVVTRVLAFLMRPLKQPRVVAEIIGGILLGPSAFGRNHDFLQSVFPPRSLTVLDTLANLGLLFFLFLTGLELDPKSIRRTGKKALGIAVAGISLPFALGIGSSFVLRQTISKNVNGPAFLVFMGVALSITAFPVLARILAELKLLTTDVGRIAMSAAAVNDVAAWILLALAIALSGSGQSSLVPLWVFLCGAAFVAGAVLVAPPVFRWMALRCDDGEPVDEMYICATLAIVLGAGFVTDTIGIHAMFGAFVIGVLVPKEGPLAGALVEKIEDLVSGLFLPLYFVSSGLKTNVATIQGLQSWGLLALVIFTACFGKIVGTFAVSILFKVPVREALALGFLMNTKGLVELIVLNIGKDRKVLNDQTFAIMVLMAIFTTFITTPLVVAVYKPARKGSTADYKHRKIERKDPDTTQLRILACFHSAGNIPSLLNLLECSRGAAKGDKLCVYAMHLMELSERSSAILMVHKARRNGLPFWNRTARTNTDSVVVAFEAYRQLGRVLVRPMTAISHIPGMHEDICSTAESKRAAIVILPFHRHQRSDGVGPAVEVSRTDFQLVNRRVLEYAPCSVGIFVDRGLGGSTHVASSSVSCFVTVLFFGGCDDREALAYGAGMAEHPGIRLTVVRLSSADADVAAEDEDEDEGLLAGFRRSKADDESVKYAESAVRSADEAVAVIRDAARECNLFLVGRTPRGGLALALDRLSSDCPELGPVGRLLISPEFCTAGSVLVVQQHSGQVPPVSLDSEAGEEHADQD